ncbi:hypothetical protein BG015_007759 [Linnemannia schmuckeri]|uniref:F-box domain-containing protein n=1 Tax=Linnemannia schmuckeri TaxID=64567 RepID=A0A9P5VB20_9FUNG|nr:hypothetical protein BG015_007759 [Linnemannia schmuckeri]
MSDADNLSSLNNNSEGNVSPSGRIVDDAETKQARVDALLESIASIPPIVDTLLSNLSYKDTLACLHVCKLWSSIAQGYLWRHVRFRDVRAVPVPLAPADKAIIRSRVRRIRSLATPLADTTFLDMPCTQLESLEIWVKTATSIVSRLAIGGFSPEDYTDTGTPFPPPLVGPTALGLIPMNRHLSSISFKQIEPLARSFTPELFLSFSQLPLQSLRLGLAWHAIETLPLAVFLAHCPVTLERLEISYDTFVTGFFGQFVNEIAMTSEQAAQLPRPPLPALKTLQISRNLRIGDATMIIFPLLRQCPNLEELWMPILPTVDVATKFFNQILRNNLSIKILRLSPPGFNSIISRNEQGYSSQDLLRVANTYRSLSEVELEVKLQDEYPVIPTLVLNSGWSLETIELTCYSAEHDIVRNPYVAAILQTCGRLKRLAIYVRGHGKSPISLRELVETNWASNQLESLMILVSEKEYRTNGWFAKIKEDNEQLQEDIAMLLFQLSMKYHAQKKYTGPIPAWLEIEAMLLPFEAAVKHTDGAMSLAAWKRIRPEHSDPVCSMPQHTPVFPPPTTTSE